jgi:hypothetical protein
MHSGLNAQLAEPGCFVRYLTGAPIGELRPYGRGSGLGVTGILLRSLARHAANWLSLWGCSQVATMQAGCGRLSRLCFSPPAPYGFTRMAAHSESLRWPRLSVTLRAAPLRAMLPTTRTKPGQLQGPAGCVPPVCRQRSDAVPCTYGVAGRMGPRGEGGRPGA